ncbi:hypothetical protein DM02DRAFT_227867 [Periconia macrospinosa]|uniref:Uncharacterized protein n=1 Tax=Periconia macrospinosa TaxID=97972 RepID=A0A2V1D5X2_9PLEO|nr:hypothetical protein DM02DRAFT_227867 [Periconia macrospinosa]
MEIGTRRIPLSLCMRSRASARRILPLMCGGTRARSRTSLPEESACLAMLSCSLAQPWEAKCVPTGSGTRPFSLTLNFTTKFIRCGMTNLNARTPRKLLPDVPKDRDWQSEFRKEMEKIGIIERIYRKRLKGFRGSSRMGFKKTRTFSFYNPFFRHKGSFRGGRCLLTTLSA